MCQNTVPHRDGNHTCRRGHGCKIIPVGVIGSGPAIDTGRGRVTKFAHGRLSGPTVLDNVLET
ncbi:hypothetical protein E2562_009603, partial [Oryza meyeriana var. granulata]